jgi:hypothetical protein
MWRVLGTTEKDTVFWWEKFMGREHLENLGINGSILKWIYMK